MVANPDSNRKPVSKRLRFEILKRDGHACKYCGATAPEVKLVVDHVIPVALGGSNEATNLTTACTSCNAGKSSTSPDAARIQQASQDALRWAEAVNVAITARAVERDDMDEYCNFVEHHWIWNVDPRGIVPDDWRSSIEYLYKRGMPLDVLTDAACIAQERVRIPRSAKWRYFMGVAWRTMDEIENDAKRFYDYRESKVGGAADGVVQSG